MCFKKPKIAKRYIMILKKIEVKILDILSYIDAQN
jgi:hypothetical protein